MKSLIKETTSDLWETPQNLFDYIENMYKYFQIDLCANKDNTKCVKWVEDIKEFSETNKIHYDRAWVNPPYSKMKEVSEACFKLLEDNQIDNIAMLIPSTRTEQEWFKKLFLYVSEGYFIQPRIKFELNGKPGQSNNHPSMLLYLDKYHDSSVSSFSILDLRETLYKREKR